MEGYSNEAIKGLAIVFRENLEIKKKVKEISSLLKKNLQMEKEVKEKLSLILKSIDVEEIFKSLLPITDNPAIHEAYMVQARQLVSIVSMKLETTSESEKEMSYLQALVNSL
jgi:hypothetical protein